MGTIEKKKASRLISEMFEMQRDEKSHLSEKTESIVGDDDNNAEKVTGKKVSKKETETLFSE